MTSELRKLSEPERKIAALFASDEAAEGLDLPPDFVVASFEFGKSFPDTPDNRQFVTRVLEQLQAHTVVALDADLERMGIELWIARPNEPLREMLHLTGLTKRLGKEHIFLTVRAAVEAYDAQFLSPP